MGISRHHRSRGIEKPVFFFSILEYNFMPNEIPLVCGWVGGLCGGVRVEWKGSWMGRLGLSALSENRVLLSVGVGWVYPLNM